MKWNPMGDIRRKRMRELGDNNAGTFSARYIYLYLALRNRVFNLQTTPRKFICVRCDVRSVQWSLRYVSFN